MSTEKYPEHKKRTLLLSDRISQGSVKGIMDSILEINTDDSEKEEIYKDWERTPIKLFINSYGGSVYDGLALIDVIKNSKTPVHTICVGSCMSMALWIWLSGVKRLVGERAASMFHDISTFAVDKTEGIKQELNEMLRLQQMLISEIVGTSAVEEEKLQDYITRKAEVYYLATVEGDQPRVRPFGTINEFEGKLYIQTGKIKPTSKQLAANPKAEICAFTDGEWVRIACELVEDDRLEAKKSMLDAYPNLRHMYDENDGNTQVFYMQSVTATFCAFGKAPEITEF